MDATIRSASGPWIATIPVSDEMSRTSTSASDRSARRSFIQDTSLAVFEALTTTMNLEPSGSRYTMMSSITPPRSFGRREYCAWPGWSAATSLVVIAWRNGTASGPDTSTWPMCPRSNKPAADRTARCSWRMPAYCTGMDHPAKGTILAPRAT